MRFIHGVLAVLLVLSLNLTAAEEPRAVLQKVADLSPGYDIETEEKSGKKANMNEFYYTGHK